MIKGDTKETSITSSELLRTVWTSRPNSRLLGQVFKQSSQDVDSRPCPVTGIGTSPVKMQVKKKRRSP